MWNGISLHSATTQNQWKFLSKCIIISAELDAANYAIDAGCLNTGRLRDAEAIAARLSVRTTLP